MNIKTALVGLSVLAAAVIVYAFISGEISENAAVRDSAPLSVGTNIWPGYEPLYLARELGYYDNNKVRLVEFASTTQVIHAFRNRVISAAALTLDEVLLLKDYGLDPKVILIFDISEGADVILARKEIPNMRALKGKKVGVENTALGAFVLMRSLQLHNMTLSDISVVSLPINEHDSAFDKGKIDALITFEPVRSRLLAKGYHEIFTSREMPGEIVDVLVVNKETLVSQQDQIDALLQGWFRANSYFQVNPNKAAKVMAGRQKISAAEVLDSYAGLHLPGLSETLTLMSGPNPPFESTARRLADTMFASKLLNNKPDLELLVDAGPLERAARPEQR